MANAALAHTLACMAFQEHERQQVLQTSNLQKAKRARLPKSTRKRKAKASGKTGRS